jgi:hypothetical protein
MKHLTILFFLFLSASTYAQTGIGTTTPHASAQLEVSSTTKGFLPPRMTKEQRNAIANPATGLQIYNLTTNTLEYKTASGWVSLISNPNGVNAGEMQYWDGSAWVSITPGDNGQVLKFINNIPTWSAVGLTYYLDSDGDGFGNAASSIVATTQPNLYVTDNTDCDDNDANEYPGQTWYIDADRDNYGVSSLVSCVRPTKGFLSSELLGTGTDDCDDSDNSVTIAIQTWYIDADGDGYGDSNHTGSEFCANPGNTYSINNSDCNDSDPYINPRAAEIGGNNVDENCDGNIFVVGDYAYGGVVFYIAPTAIDLNSDGVLDFGLICSIEDLTSQNGVIFSTNLGVYTGVTNYRVGFGKSNTDYIIQNGINCPPVSLTNAYSGGGYTDWYLPSTDEVIWIYKSKDLINTTAGQYGGSDFLAPNDGYWSSFMEAGDTSRIKWSNGTAAFKDRSTTIHGVRAIRAF